MKDDEKNALIEHRISKAIATIDEVDFLISNKKLLLAVNRNIMACSTYYQRFP